VGVVTLGAFRRSHLKKEEVRELTSQFCFCWFAIYLWRARDETKGASAEPTAVHLFDLQLTMICLN
jgi:hypothetical protein